MVVENLMNELNSMDDNHWTYSLEQILRILNFPVELEYVCDWEEYLYSRSGRLRYFSSADKKMLSDCLQIASYCFLEMSRSLKIIAVDINGNRRLRNEKACLIYKIFRRVYGKHLIFIACFKGELAFLGTITSENKKNKVIISDWFGRNSSRAFITRLAEIDFLMFSNDDYKSLYADYLWAIARPYVKYSESKLYLTYGCEYVDLYETVVLLPFDNELVWTFKVDQETTLEHNSSYYPIMYGYDYYLDESSDGDDEIEIKDEDESEFEWTMLEMELEKEFGDVEESEIDWDDSNEENNDRENEYLSGLTPEEMLELIRDTK